MTAIVCHTHGDVRWMSGVTCVVRRALQHNSASRHCVMNANYTPHTPDDNVDDNATHTGHTDDNVDNSSDNIDHTTPVQAVHTPTPTPTPTTLVWPFSYALDIRHLRYLPDATYYLCE
jgi:hypothetical protein